VPSTTVTVDPPTIFGALFSPDSVAAGSPTTLYVLLTAPAAPGAQLTVQCNSTRLTIGTTLACQPGLLLQAFQLPTTSGPPTSVTVTVSYNGTSGTAVLYITP
jgi:hypothetical protein